MITINVRPETHVINYKRKCSIIKALQKPIKIIRKIEIFRFLVMMTMMEGNDDDDNDLNVKKRSFLKKITFTVLIKIVINWYF